MTRAQRKPGTAAGQQAPPATATAAAAASASAPVPPTRPMSAGSGGGGGGPEYKTRAPAGWLEGVGGWFYTGHGTAGQQVAPCASPADKGMASATANFFASGGAGNRGEMDAQKRQQKVAQQQQQQRGGGSSGAAPVGHGSSRSAAQGAATGGKHSRSRTPGPQPAPAPTNSPMVSQQMSLTP